MSSASTTTAATSAPRLDAPKVPLARTIGALATRPVLILVAALALITAGAHLIWINGLVIVIDIVSLIVVHRALRAEGGGLGQLLGRWRWRYAAWGLLMGLLLLITFYASLFIANLIVYQGPPPASSGSAASIPLWFGLVGLLIMPITIALAEECVYRGYAQPRLGRNVGAALSLIIVAVIFGIQHIGFALTDPQAVAAKVIATLLTGLVFGLLMLWMRRVTPLIIGHWIVDLLGLGLPMLMLALA